MSDANQALVPPHSDEAEQAVLGSLLLENDAFDRMADLLQPGDFYHAVHREVYASLVRLLSAGKAADVVTVFEAGGHDLKYLNAMAQSVPSAANVRRYAEIVRARSVERQLLRAGGHISELAVAPGQDVRGKIDAAQSMLAKLGEIRSDSEPVSIDEAIVGYIDHLEAESQGRTRVLPTGLRHLDRQLNGGLREGELMVVGARPKMGKTALVLTMQRAMARNYSTLLLSQEMPKNELVGRHMAALGSVNLADLRRPDAGNTSMWSSIAQATDELRTLNILLDDQRALTLVDVRRKVMQAKRKHGLDVVFVDFLQLMAGDGDNRNQELDRISNGLKAMAGEFKIAVVLLSQLSREADKRNGPPVMTDLRDSGAIEAAADIIALLYREYASPLGQKTEDFKQFAQLEVVQRNGAPGTVAVGFSGEFQRFFDWEGPWPHKTGGRSGYKGGGLS